MTATTASLLPITRKRVLSALISAGSRHGVDRATAEAIFADLTTGNDPRPSHIPEVIHYRGLPVYWPVGRGARYLTNAEVKIINRALEAAGVRKSEWMTREDTAETGRTAVEFLLKHKGHPNYNPEPVHKERLRKLVEEATAPQDEPILVREGTPEHANYAPENRLTPAASVCGAPGPFAGVTCEKLTHRHEDELHEGFGYGWTGEQEQPVTEPSLAESTAALADAFTDELDKIMADLNSIDTPEACPFDKDECIAQAEAGEGECATGEHEPPTVAEVLAAERSVAKAVEHVIVPDAKPEPTSTVADLLAQVNALQSRLAAL